MLALRVLWQLKLWWECHIKLVIVPKWNIGYDLESVVRVLSIMKIIVSNDHFMKGGGSIHN
jgi:hypothetical protein